MKHAKFVSFTEIGAQTAAKAARLLPDFLCERYARTVDLSLSNTSLPRFAQQAMVDCDIEPQMKPIRGGTDGAQLSFMGLPCPNLFTGGYNYHGKHEFVTLEGMEKAVQVIVRIAELTAARKGH